MATGGRGDDPDTCGVCLEGYRDPKFLPCHHTYCARCIQDIADRHDGGDFPCPACRNITSLPPGGVTSLQTNFFIKSQSSAPTAAVKDMCSIHDDKKLEFYCVKCDMPICLNCKLTDHELHKTQDLKLAASDKKKELKTHQERVQRAVSTVTNHTTSLKEQQQSLVKKTEALKTNILERHAMLTAAADKERDITLLALQSRHDDINNDLDLALQQEADKLDKLLAIQQQLDDAVKGTNHSDVIAVTKEMRSGRGSKAAIKALTSQDKERIRQPVLQCDVGTDAMIETMRGYLGKVTDLDITVSDPDLTTTEMFQCGDKAEVFSLCHRDGDTPAVWVSYERLGMTVNVNMQMFSETGQNFMTGDQVGKVSYKRCYEGQGMSLIPRIGRFITYNKILSAHFRLDNNLSGKANIDLVTVTSTQPFKTNTTTQFTIEVGPHRAFDSHPTGHLFVVVEEAVTPSPWRSVRLYKKSERKAIATYQPPTPHYQPSDVCFFYLHGKEVLLITDELNDAIHVVTIQSDAFTFERYLCAGCPSLIQPTAITVDVHNRLWVACRGGAVITLHKP